MSEGKRGARVMDVGIHGDIYDSKPIESWLEKAKASVMGTSLFGGGVVYTRGRTKMMRCGSFGLSLHSL